MAIWWFKRLKDSHFTCSFDKNLQYCTFAEGSSMLQNFMFYDATCIKQKGFLCKKIQGICIFYAFFGLLYPWFIFLWSVVNLLFMLLFQRFAVFFYIIVVVGLFPKICSLFLFVFLYFCSFLHKFRLLFVWKSFKEFLA